MKLMSRKFPGSIFVAAALISSISCLPVESQKVTDRGKPVMGVQLSIATSNSVMAAGSTNVVHCQIKNLSTNGIEIDRAMSLLPETSFFITSGSRKFFKLKPYASLDGSAISGIHIKAGEIYEWFAPVEIGREIGSGNYELKAALWIIIPLNDTNNPGGELVSNSLKMRVRRNFWF